MKFHEYLESSYVGTNIELQVEYSPQKQAKTLAAQSLINGQRTFYKVVSYVVLVVGYLLVKAHIVKAPLSAADLVKAYQDNARAQMEAKGGLQAVPPAPESK